MTEPDHQQLSESTVEPGKKTGGALEPWDVGNLPAPPVLNWNMKPSPWSLSVELNFGV